ncbi:MAG: hypothetical protein A3A97_02935 [Candidatus Terrybacteria bacterium RIFCSPLOWO2_01_FULL_40_23]|uniref:Uncharacterized protein n=1 Tax=Candidatus Terrybacteria bacterium RIFCSPLOWO2_01_FULL_40_23 TaxID=1802366 RepID=A0A1G2PUC8_9BACT|nr:MAG: hypothetical protein A3A97_02935 [Candidatus Terrybacteria bacterium RIFCSPLOWO2_01_FULL_40_23]
MLPSTYENEYYKAEIINKVVIDGHEVGYFLVVSKTGYAEYLLSCDCAIIDDKEFGFNPWDSIGGKRCKYLHAAMALRQYEVAQEIGEKYDLDDLATKFPYISDALKDAVLELFTRSQNNEWLGGHTNYLPGTLVSEILKYTMEFGADMEQVWTCVNILEREEKLSVGFSFYIGVLVPYDKKRKVKNPIYPYLRKKISIFSVKVFSPIHGCDPLEWLIQVFNHSGKNVYEVRIPIEYLPKWLVLSETKEERYHPVDIARMNLALAETEDKIWNNNVEWAQK